MASTVDETELREREEAKRGEGPGRPKGGPASKELRALGRRFKQGFRWERTGSNHFRVVDRDGRLVEHRGRPIQVSQNPSPGVVRAFTEQLEEAQVLQGTEPRQPGDEAAERRRKASRAAVAERTQQRQQLATELQARYRAVFDKMGGLGTPGLAQDLGRVAAFLLRGTPRQGMTPDLLAGSAYRAIVNGAWVDERYRDVWIMVAERLERVSDPVGEWFSLVRDAKGLPASTVQFRLPQGSQDEWPFRVELLPLESLLVDESYQRPPSWPFVRREAARYDPTLVGTVDVAQRSPSLYAILDGQQRVEIVRLVGKGTVWASIYQGLDLQSEARFFLHKNSNRKNMHPYYTFRARVASGDQDAAHIERIVHEYGYKLAIGAPSAGRGQHHISAISGVIRAYGRKLPDGSDALTPTLAVLSKATLGRAEGQSSLLIRGLSQAFLDRPDMDHEKLIEVVGRLGPDLIIGRARDIVRPGLTGEQAIARIIVGEYAKATRRKKAA
jgi:hypothetical protein